MNLKSLRELLESDFWEKKAQESYLVEENTAVGDQQVQNMSLAFDIRKLPISPSRNTLVYIFVYCMIE